MTESITCAVQSDGRTIYKNQSEEETAARDRDAARQLAADSQFGQTMYASAPVESPNVDDEMLDKLAALYVTRFDKYDKFDYEEDSETESPAEASRIPSRNQPDRRQIHRRCEACRDEHKFFDVARAPCNHEYCRGCLQELFEASLIDETLFPPRCCRQPISMERVRLFLPSKTVKEFAKKRIEFETPNRTYCSAARCSIFIPPAQIDNGIGACQECGTRTCITCKGGAHGGDCPEDVALQEVLAQAAENGWQRCYSCWRLVELERGCYHMT